MLRFSCFFPYIAERQTATAKAESAKAQAESQTNVPSYSTPSGCYRFRRLSLSISDLPTIPSTWENDRSISRSIRAVPALRERALWITHIWEFRQVVFPSTVGGDAKSSAWAKIGSGLPIPRTQVQIVAIPQSIQFWTVLQGSQVRVLRKSGLARWFSGEGCRVSA